MRALVGDGAHVGRAVALAHAHVEHLLHLAAQRFSELLRGHESGLEVQVLLEVEPAGRGLLADDLEVAGHAHEAGDRELAHEVDLGVGVAGPGRDHGAADLPQGLLQHVSGRGQVVAEGHLDQVAGPESGRVESLGPAPEVGGVGLGVQNGARGLVDAAQLARGLGEHPAQAFLGLQADDLLLAQHGDAREVPGVAQVLGGESGPGHALAKLAGVPRRRSDQILEPGPLALTQLLARQRLLRAPGARVASLFDHGLTPASACGAGSV